MIGIKKKLRIKVFLPVEPVTLCVNAGLVRIQFEIVNDLPDVGDRWTAKSKRICWRPRWTITATTAENGNPEAVYTTVLIRTLCLLRNLIPVTYLIKRPNASNCVINWFATMAGHQYLSSWGSSSERPIRLYKLLGLMKYNFFNIENGIEPLITHKGKGYWWRFLMDQCTKLFTW